MSLFGRFRTEKSGSDSSSDNNRSRPDNVARSGEMSPVAVITIELVKWGVTIALSYYLSCKLVAMMNEMAGQGGKGDIISARRVLAKRLKRPEVEVMDMNAYEARISADVFSPDDIDTTFEHIGGLEEELADVKDNVVLPMQMYKLFKGSSDIPPCPTGVLLYGRPGTGKTLTAKAIAKECGATFISIKASTIMDKWFGESDKLVTALFSLGRKLAPCVIFIDEIDTLLKRRDGTDGSSSALHSMQGAFLAEWDGLSSTSEAPVVVLGATNRPMDLDKAFLRRMPVSIKLAPPDQQGRMDILEKMLMNEKVDKDVSLSELAKRTEDFTGSDLREVVRVACLQRAKDVVRRAREKMGKMVHKQVDMETQSGVASSSTDNLIAAMAEHKSVDSTAPLVNVSKAAAFVHMRPLLQSDFDFALTKTRKSDSAATDYASELLVEAREESVQIVRKVLETLGQPIPGKNEKEEEEEITIEEEAMD